MNGEIGTRILGIDPGSRVAGFGVLEVTSVPVRSARALKLVASGVVRTATSDGFANRLGQLHEAIYKLVSQHSPTICIVEKAFVGHNASSALKLGEARGAITSALRRHKLTVHELTPAEVKKSIAGHSAAQKEDVQK